MAVTALAGRAKRVLPLYFNPFILIYNAPDMSQHAYGSVGKTPFAN
jgi:hypothetical protein